MYPFQYVGMFVYMILPLYFKPVRLFDPFQVREVDLIDAAIADKTSRKQGCFGWQRPTLAAVEATLLPKSGTCEINLR